jgi:hypothetical protein
MRKWLSRRMFHALVRYVFKGITPRDFINTTKLSDGQYQQYCFDGKSLKGNIVFKTELQRLRYKQERYLINTAQTAEDLLFGKAVLYTIDTIEKRVEHLAKTADQILADKREDDKG